MACQYVNINDRVSSDYHGTSRAGVGRVLVRAYFSFIVYGRTSGRREFSSGPIQPAANTSPEAR